MLTHRNLIANCEQCRCCRDIATRTDDVVWLALPLFHIYAMNVGMNLTIMNGATMVLIERFEPASSLEAIQTNKCTVLYGAPPMFVVWAQMPNIHDYDLIHCATSDPAPPRCRSSVLESFQRHGGGADQRGLWPLRGRLRSSRPTPRPRPQARHGRLSDSRRRGQDSR